MCTETFCTGYEILAALSGGLKESADQRIEVSTTVYSEFKDSSTWNNLSTPMARGKRYVAAISGETNNTTRLPTRSLNLFYIHRGIYVRKRAEGLSIRVSRCISRKT